MRLPQPGDRVEHVALLIGTVLDAAAPEGFVVVHWDGCGPDFSVAVPVHHVTVLSARAGQQ